MTVMLDRYFGIHQEVIRRGLWKLMRHRDKDLYTFLMHQSEKYSDRRVRCSDREIRKLMGTPLRSVYESRKNLRKLGLIKFKNTGHGFEYDLCDPNTLQPYPLGSKERIRYIPKADRVISSLPHQTKAEEVQGLSWTSITENR